MDEKLKKIKCVLCEKEAYILIRVECASDSSFFSSAGICCECFKDGNIDEKIFLKNKDFIGNQMETAKDRMDYWKKELKNLNQ